MTLKQWNAVIMLVGQVLITVWLVGELAVAGVALSVADVSARLLWAGAIMIGFNIVAAIVIAIIVAIATRGQVRDERADERDRAIYARSMRNAYFVVSIGGVVTLVLLALGHDPVLAAYAIFAGGMLAGAAGSLSQLIYYRVG